MKCGAIRSIIDYSQIYGRKQNEKIRIKSSDRNIPQQLYRFFKTGIYRNNQFVSGIMNTRFRTDNFNFFKINSI